MVGLPEYSTYVEHMETTHPGEPVMTYEAYFRNRQEARYGGAGEGEDVVRKEELRLTFSYCRLLNGPLQCSSALFPKHTI